MSLRGLALAALALLALGPGLWGFARKASPGEAGLSPVSLPQPVLEAKPKPAQQGAPAPLGGLLAPPPAQRPSPKLQSSPPTLPARPLYLLYRRLQTDGG
ncbi:hypothetical protein DV704_06780 [Meiothermus sp. QL-1]|uniref:hypothetical protein n=1 Tax=Meiothermus sp. QL-1 TaxID=2058095 RepID=UPI000E0C34AB|nr:hypothetical protein [Meiothermus sp. QL-1]RDI95577.1 hypothetical protein DV704_06780 [Meiothermus sp. QL-1]